MVTFQQSVICYCRCSTIYVLLTGRPEHVARQISLAARAFTDGKAVLPRVDVLALQEADKATRRTTGGHHVAENWRSNWNAWAHAPPVFPGH